MDAFRPVAGVHYPRSAGEFQSWFRTDDDCLDYLDWLRWPDGFACPECGQAGGWALGDARYKCAACGKRTSVTAGTLFDRRRTPLTVWFAACWMFATQKDGVSALSVQRALEIGSYPTAWAMLHRLRSVLVRPGRELLAGTVEVDETFIGGEEPGLRGGRQRGKKSLAGIAVEVAEPRGIGRCRMQILADASAESLHPFVTASIAPGTRVITDGWQGYAGLARLGYVHERRSQRAARSRGEDPGKLLPAVHRVASLAKAGCWAPTRARSTTRTWPPTSTSSCSASTGAAPAAGDCCSTACSSSQSPTTPSGTGAWSPARSRRPAGRHRQVSGGSRLAWTACRLPGHGVPLTCTSPVR